MPITHRGTHICEKCRNNFKWYRFEWLRAKYPDIPTVEKLPDPKDGVSVRHWEQAGNTAICDLHCPNCGHYNAFNVDMTETACG